MDSSVGSTIELLERKLIQWEKGLYASYAVAFTVLAHAVIKARENMVLTDVLFYMERTTRSTPPLITSQYNADILYIMGSAWRSTLWIIVEMVILILVTTLAVHPTWRTFPLAKRLDLIFGYLLAGWIVLLSLGAQMPLEVGNGLNVLLVGSLFILGLAYRWFRRKKDTAEEIFP